MTVMENTVLAPFTTFKIGGPARYFAEVKNTDELVQAIQFARKKALPIFILGGGSNILISDRGFEGLVILNRLSGTKIRSNGLIEIASGENWDDTVARTVKADLGGFECLSGIPGTIGGAIVQNIGAYGQTISDVVEEIEAIDWESGDLVVFPKEECDFAYRTSKFKTLTNRYLITKVICRLFMNPTPTFNYPDLIKQLATIPNPTLQQVSDAVIEIRASKGHVILPGYENYLSAGSFFKNPIVDQNKFKQLQNTISCPGTWHWEVSADVKISAACLIQSAGFKKGYTHGRVGISPKHPLVLINLGGATADDIMEFAELIKSAVNKKFGIILEEEILRIGGF